MDGAVVLDREGTRILRAATQLVPDSSIETTESGTRHRTAERVAKQTGFPVISVSQSMGVVALYVGDLRHVIEGSPTTLSRADQALQTLERYKARLDEVTGTLSALEIEDLVTIRDVTAVLQRLEMVRRISAEIQDYVVELGTDGRLLTLQLEELVGGLGNDRELVIRDYLPATKSSLDLDDALANLQALNSVELLDLAAGARAVGFSVVGDSLDAPVSPQGYRLLTKVPRLPTAIVDRLVDALRVAPATARRRHRGPHARRGRRRGPGPRRARGPLAPRRVEHPRALRLTGSPPLPYAVRLAPARRCSTSASTRGTPRPGRDLPWREPDCSPWGVFLSEVMSQQTPLARVEPVWREWMERWPTPADLAAALPAMPCGPGDGSATRAGRCGCTRRPPAMVERHGGEVPRRPRGAARPARVGAYTAAAVSCFAFGNPEVVVDTNVRRVLARTLEGKALPAPDPQPGRGRARRGAAMPADRATPPTRGTSPSWSSARWSASLEVPAARSARSPTSAPGTSRAGPPTTDRPDAARPGTAPTGRCAERSCAGCARPTRALPLTALEDAGDDRGQVMRCLDSLVADGLVEPLSRQRFRLPT